MTRVYIACTATSLVSAVNVGVLATTGDAVHAVTPAVAGFDPGAGRDDLEEIALRAAADASLHLLLAGDPVTRRLVVAADAEVEPAAADDPAGPAAVRLRAPVRTGDAVSVHLDDDAAVPDVAAAVAATASGTDVDPEAVDHELLWFDAGEIPALVVGPLARPSTGLPPWPDPPGPS